MTIYGNKSYLKLINCIISGISYLIFLDRSWSWVIETVESKTVGKGNWITDNWISDLHNYYMIIM
jgi:hypothetical protein